jgi:hypothetical protein
LGLFGLALAAVFIFAVLFVVAPQREQAKIPRQAAGVSSSEPPPRNGGAPSTSPANLSQENGDQSKAQSATTLRAVTQPAAPLPLPPRNTPLVQIYESLAMRAKAGDPQAACRLAVELDRCRPSRLSALTQFLKKRESEIAALPPEGAEAATKRKYYAAGVPFVKEQLAICSGFEDRAAIPAWQYLYSAASSGHVPSMARFVISPPLDLENLTVEPDGWRTYRESASLFLRQAADAGDRRAVGRLAAEYSGTVPALGGAQIVDEDTYQAAKYVIAAQAFPENRDSRSLMSLLERARRSLTPIQQEDAKSEGEALVASWPEGRLQAQDDKTQGPGIPNNGADCEH